jgi:hypothetical protein
MEQPLPFIVDYFSDPKYRSFIPIERITYDNRHFINTDKYPTIKEAMNGWTTCDPFIAKLPVECQLAIIKHVYCPNDKPVIGDKRANKIQMAQLERIQKDSDKYFAKLLKRNERIMKKKAVPQMVYFD